MTEPPKVAITSEASATLESSYSPGILHSSTVPKVPPTAPSANEPSIDTAIRQTKSFKTSEALVPIDVDSRIKVLEGGNESILDQAMDLDKAPFHAAQYNTVSKTQDFWLEDLMHYFDALESYECLEGYRMRVLEDIHKRRRHLVKTLPLLADTTEPVYRRPFVYGISQEVYQSIVEALQNEKSVETFTNRKLLIAMRRLIKNMDVRVDENLLQDFPKPLPLNPWVDRPDIVARDETYVQLFRQAIADREEQEETRRKPAISDEEKEKNQKGKKRAERGRGRGRGRGFR
jgi:hypothetical protein